MLICFLLLSRNERQIGAHFFFVIFFSSSARFGLIRRSLSSNGRVRADVKSERRGVAESPPPLPEPVKIGLVDYADDGDVSTMPWWEQFPKRWAIVILCFTAFLLCNMDRVNMSIATLPMATEFLCNSTTVRLIQSLFFWGYLLTQIAGGVAASWFVLSLALVYSGMYLGSITGLSFSLMLILEFGWPSVVFSFGSLGAVWFTWWLSQAYSSPLEDPQLLPEDKKLILSDSKVIEPVKSIPWKLI